MQQSVFIAKCPYEIGDKVIKKTANMVTTESSLNILDKARTITDIAALHFLNEGIVEFCYELDNSGVYEDLKGNEIFKRRKKE